MPEPCETQLVNEPFAITVSGDTITDGSTILPIPGNPTTMTFAWTFTTDNHVCTQQSVLVFCDAAGEDVPKLTPALSTGTANASGTFVQTEIDDVQALGLTHYRMRLIVLVPFGPQTFNATIAGTVTWTGCEEPELPALGGRQQMVTILG